MGECPACGAVISPGTNFCAECGTDLTAAAPKEVAGPDAADEAKQSASDLAAPESISTKPGVLGKSEEHPALAAIAKLVLLKGGSTTDTTFEFSGAAVIGRFDRSSGPVDIDLSILPDAATISRIHAQLRCTGPESWVVKDLGSSNGTFFREVATEPFQRVEGEQPVKHGDELAFGNARFRFEL